MVVVVIMIAMVTMQGAVKLTGFGYAETSIFKRDASGEEEVVGNVADTSASIR